MTDRHPSDLGPPHGMRVIPNVGGRSSWLDPAGVLDGTLSDLDRRVDRQAAEAPAAAGQAGPARDVVHDTRTACEREIRRFTAEYGAKYPKAVAALTADQERLLTLFDYPADHWRHLRTTNPIESTLATVRLRERVTKGAGSRTAGLTMAFQRLEAAQAHWRRLDGADLIPLVRAGVRFVDGVRVERQEERKEGAAYTNGIRSLAAWGWTVLGVLVRGRSFGSRLMSWPTLGPRAP